MSDELQFVVLDVRYALACRDLVLNAITAVIDLQQAEEPLARGAKAGRQTKVRRTSHNCHKSFPHGVILAEPAAFPIHRSVFVQVRE
jgi:hypothetical protein